MVKKIVLVLVCILILGEFASSVRRIRRRKKIPYKPKPCIDCWGYKVPPRTKYWDGCNQVMCDSHYPPKSHFLTRCWCEFVDCVHRCGSQALRG